VAIIRTSLCKAAISDVLQCTVHAEVVWILVYRMRQICGRKIVPSVKGWTRRTSSWCKQAKRICINDTVRALRRQLFLLMENLIVVGELCFLLFTYVRTIYLHNLDHTQRVSQKRASLACSNFGIHQPNLMMLICI